MAARPNGQAAKEAASAILVTAQGLGVQSSSAAVTQATIAKVEE